VTQTQMQAQQYLQNRGEIMVINAIPAAETPRARRLMVSVSISTQIGRWKRWPDQVV
jgi:hypothetical protein